MRFLLPLLTAALLSGCCSLDDTCEVADAGLGNNPPPAADALSSPGCDPDSIDVQGAVVCADCAFASDAICGAPNEATCEVRENSFGEACQLCVTADGVILYDDCFTGQENVREAAFCEESVGANDDEACKVCFDDNGNTVSTSCGPRADECTDVVGADGRVCTRCTTNGELVSNVCESVDLDPSLCRAYGNEQGECVDCFDDDNALLSHSCTPAGGTTGLVSCEETVSPDGLVCTVCIDENGTTVERSCAEVQPEPQHCGQLVYTEQTCIVCVDDVNAVVFIDCQRNDCAVVDSQACRVDADCGTSQVCFDSVCVAQSSGAPPPPNDEPDPGRPEPAPPQNICEAPPACQNDVGDDGALCRTCPVTGPDGLVGTETRCVSAGLACEVVPESSVTTEGDGFAPPPEDPQGNNCVICKDTASGVEVYRDCGSNGSVPPPYCLSEDVGDGSLCSVCYDAVTDAPVYTSCGDETCFALESEVLVDAQQAPLLVDGVTATVACKRCGAANSDVAVDASAFTATCSLENVCQDPFGTSFAGCPTTTTLLIAPRVCSNPWDAWVFGSSDVDLLQGVLAFPLGERGLALAAASIVQPAADVVCDGCGCESGMRIELLVPNADVDVVAALFDGFVVR